MGPAAHTSQESAQGDLEGAGTAGGSLGADTPCQCPWAVMRPQPTQRASTSWVTEAPPPRGQRNLKLQPPPAGKGTPPLPAVGSSLEREVLRCAAGGRAEPPEGPEGPPVLSLAGFRQPRRHFTSPGGHAASAHRAPSGGSTEGERPMKP